MEGPGHKRYPSSLRRDAPAPLQSEIKLPKPPWKGIQRRGPAKVVHDSGGAIAHSLSDETTDRRGREGKGR